MASVNKVILVGNLGKDPEVRHTPSGKVVASFSLATTERWGKGDERKEETEWHRVVAWERLGEICGEYLHKGSPGLHRGKAPDPLLGRQGREQTIHHGDRCPDHADAGPLRQGKLCGILRREIPVRRAHIHPGRRHPVLVSVGKRPSTALPSPLPRLRGGRLVATDTLRRGARYKVHSTGKRKKSWIPGCAGMTRQAACGKSVREEEQGEQGSGVAGRLARWFG